MHIRVTQIKLRMIFFMYVAVIQRLNYSGEESKTTQFVDNVSDTLRDPFHLETRSRSLNLA